METEDSIPVLRRAAFYEAQRLGAYTCVNSMHLLGVLSIALASSN